MTDSTSDKPGTPGAKPASSPAPRPASGAVAAAPADSGGAGRPAPAAAPVIGTRDAAPVSNPAPAGGARPLPLIESTLVGNGDGLPAATARTLRLTDPVEDTAAKGTTAKTAPKQPKADIAPGLAASGADSAKPGSADIGVPKPAASTATMPGSSLPKVGAGASSAATGTAPVGMPADQSSPARPGDKPAISSTDRPAAADTSRTQTAAVSPAPVVVRRGGFLPMFLGGVAAAAIGAGAAWWAIPRYAPHLLTAPGTAPATAVAPAADSAAIEARSVEAARAAASETAAEIARNTATEAAQAALAASTAGMAQAGAPLSEADARAATEAATAAATKAGADAGARSGARSGAEAARAALAGMPDTGAGLADQIAALDKGLAELRERPQTDPGLAQRIDKLAAELDQTRARLDQIQRASEDAARRSAAAAMLAQALDHPVEPAARASAVKTLEPHAGADAARLGEVVSLTELRARWDDAARAALRAANAAGQDGGSGNALTSFLRAQTGARSIEPRDGQDADAVLSRAGDAVRRGAIAQALNELDALPEAAREPMARWQADARNWVAASAAVAAMGAPDQREPAQPAAPSAGAPAGPAAAPSAGTAPPAASTDPAAAPATAQ